MDQRKIIRSISRHFSHFQTHPQDRFVRYSIKKRLEKHRPTPLTSAGTPPHTRETRVCDERVSRGTGYAPLRIRGNERVTRRDGGRRIDFRELVTRESNFFMMTKVLNETDTFARSIAEKVVPSGVLIFIRASFFSTFIFIRIYTPFVSFPQICNITSIKITGKFVMQCVRKFYDNEAESRRSRHVGKLLFSSSTMGFLLNSPQQRILSVATASLFFHHFTITIDT